MAKASPDGLVREITSGWAYVSGHSVGEQARWTVVSTVPRLDTDIFVELYESVCEQRDVVTALYRTFFSNAANLIAALKATESHAEREKTLHTLKGSAAMMGATCIARLAADLQQTCGTMQADTLRNWIDHLDAELDATRRDVDAQLSSLDASEAK